MRFVSRVPQLGLGAVVTEKFVLALDGQRDKTRETVSVQFSQNNLTPADIEFALAYWPASQFQGRWMDADEVTLQPLEEFIGVFDTDLQGYDENEDEPNLKERVEKWMLAKPNYGDYFIQVTTVPQVAGKPWPSYDDTHHFKIAPLAQELGLLEEALAYEQANKNRDGVVEKLTEALAPAQVSEADEVVAA